MSRATFRMVLAEFGLSLGLNGLDVDAYGYARLDVDAFPLHISYIDERDELLFSIALAAPPIRPPASLLWWLLTESHEQMQIRGVSFAIDADDNRIVLMRRIPTKEMTVEALTREIEMLAALAETGAKAIIARAELNHTLAAPKPAGMDGVVGFKI